MKIFGNSNVSRVLHLLLMLIPFFIISLIIVIKNDLHLIISKGYVIFIIVYFIIAFYEFKWNIIDKEMYFIDNKILIKGIFSKEKIYSENNQIKVDCILILTFLFNLYKIRLNNEEFVLKSTDFYHPIEKLFRQQAVCKSIENKINKILSNSTN